MDSLKNEKHNTFKEYDFNLPYTFCWSKLVFNALGILGVAIFISIIFLTGIVLGSVFIAINRKRTKD